MIDHKESDERYNIVERKENGLESEGSETDGIYKI